MSKKAKKIGLIIIVLLIVIAATLMLIPAIIGMNYGYDSAQMEIKIRENCNCKSVTKDNTYSPSESFPETITSGKPINKFKFILTDCHYNSLTDLSQDILVMVKNENLCSNKDIVLTINDSGKESKLIVENCIIKE